MDRVLQILNGTKVVIGLLAALLAGTWYVFSMDAEIRRIDRYGTQAGEERGARIEMLEQKLIRMEWNIYLLGRGQGIEGLVAPPEGRPGNRGD